MLRIKAAAKGAAKAAAKSLEETSAKLLPIGSEEVTKAAPVTGTAFPVGATGAAVPAPAEPNPAIVSAEPKKLSKEELMQLGEKTYLNRCAMCHQANGVGMPPIFPALKGSKMVIGPVTDHMDRVFNGKAGTAMQAFRNQLTDEELAAVITYERNAWDNNANIVVQPADIKAVKKNPA